MKSIPRLELRADMADSGGQAVASFFDLTRSIDQTAHDEVEHILHHRAEWPARERFSVLAHCPANRTEGTIVLLALRGP